MLRSKLRILSTDKSHHVNQTFQSCDSQESIVSTSPRAEGIGKKLIETLEQKKAQNLPHYEFYQDYADSGAGKKHHHTQALQSPLSGAAPENSVLFKQEHQASMIVLQSLQSFRNSSVSRSHLPHKDFSMSRTGFGLRGLGGQSPLRKLLNDRYQSRENQRITSNETPLAAAEADLPSQLGASFKNRSRTNARHESRSLKPQTTITLNNSMDSKDDKRVQSPTT